MPHFEEASNLAENEGFGNYRKAVDENANAEVIAHSGGR
jgi:hypothetical protein